MCIIFVRIHKVNENAGESYISTPIYKSNLYLIPPSTCMPCTLKLVYF